MKIPKSLKIGGMEYKVELTEKDNMGDNLADTDFNKSVIRIDKSADKQQQSVAFIHEILHACNNQLKEEEVEFLAMTIYQVLHDNKLKF